MYKTAYLVGDFFLTIIWLILFFKRKDLRQEQLLVGILGAIFAPVTQYLMFHKDYWRPEYIFGFNLNGVTMGIEEPLFGFIIGGIAATIYESIFRKKQNFSKPRNFLALVIIVSILFTAIFLNGAGINSIWASIVCLIAGSLAMVTIDKDLVKDAILSGVFFTTLTMGIYFFWFSIYPNALQKFWVVGNLSGINVWRIPIEEIAWFFSAGIFGGIFYEFWRNVKSYSKK